MDSGKRIGPYEIVEEIGRGGMAVVYKAFQPQMKRHVAIKVLPDVLAAEETFISRFQQEAETIARLEHPRILPVYDFGKQENTIYIVMRYVDSGTLKDRMQHGLMPLLEIARIVGQIAEALDYAHDHGVIHRDLKPANVFLDRQGNVLLGDFGLAKIAEGTGQLTTSGAFLGTPAYMSPEQGSGDLIDRRSDVYALGLILFELLVGRQPFEAQTPMALVLKHITEPIPDPRSLVPTLPDAVADAVLKATAKARDERYPTAGAFTSALASAVGAAVAAGQTDATPPPPLSRTTTSPAVAGTSQPSAMPASTGTAPGWTGTSTLVQAGPAHRVGKETPSVGAAAAAVPAKPTRRRGIFLGVTILSIVAVVSAALVGALILFPGMTTTPTAVPPTPPPTVISGLQMTAASETLPTATVTPAPTVTPLPTFTPLPALSTGEKPAEPRYYQVAEDCITGDRFVEGIPNRPDPLCDIWEIDLYERPFNAEKQDRFFPDLDLVRTSVGQDLTWYYFRIQMFGLREGKRALTAAYRIELDTNSDGRGDWLIEVQAPTANLGDQWGQKGLTVWLDSNGDVGDQDPFAPDPPQNHGNGYDLVVFSQEQTVGDPRNAAFARIDPSSPKTVEIAVWRQLVGNARSFRWRVSAEQGLPDPAAMNHQDAYTKTEAGAPYPTDLQYPTRKIFETDNLCGWITTGAEGPLPCRRFPPEPGEAEFAAFAADFSEEAANEPPGCPEFSVRYPFTPCPPVTPTIPAP